MAAATWLIITFYDKGFNRLVPEGEGCYNKKSCAVSERMHRKYEEKEGEQMAVSGNSRVKDYIFLHISIMIFSFTPVFTKMASIEFNKNGIWGIKLYFFFFLMLLDCFIYALAWQKNIQKFELSVAYANKSVYLIWSQIWAVLIFGEVLSIKNVIGLLVVLIGVLVVQRYE